MKGTGQGCEVHAGRHLALGRCELLRVGRGGATLGPHRGSGSSWDVRHQDLRLILSTSSSEDRDQVLPPSSFPCFRGGSDGKII